MPAKPIKKFVLEPLPQKIKSLIQKFPELGETFEKVGITKIADIQKLRGVKFTLPGLTRRLGLPEMKVEPGRFALFQDVPVDKLPIEVKEQLPTEIVFARTAGELIDFNITLSLD